jgi:hypothetical protein
LSRDDDLLSRLDVAAVNSGIFFPRPDPGHPPPAGSVDMVIDVPGGDRLAARWHPAGPEAPTILHFHGNGEIVGDYDVLAPVFISSGASVVFAEFRGYGLSTGRPSVSALVQDAHPVLDAVLRELSLRGHSGPLVLMGRSLGSAPAIELASTRPGDVAGLVVESGFARVLPLLGLLGVAVGMLGLDRIDGMDNEDKMARVTAPLLLLHAEGDTIVPLWHAERNLEQAASTYKRLVTIPDADHNTIMAGGGELYWGSLAVFLEGLSA